MQLRTEHAAVQVDPPLGRCRRQWVPSGGKRKPQVEIVIERSDLPVGNPELRGDS